MKQHLIKRYKQFRLQSYFKERTFKHQYAFIGIGNHSLSNLYPVIHYLNIPLKYIHTRTHSTAQQLAELFPQTQAASLDKILSDNEIKGVFICVSPAHQFQIARKLLSAEKFVFVEKPPCQTLEELDQLIDFGNRCLIGLQKRYAAINKILKKKNFAVCTYNYRYLTGTYPEGDPLMDIFIHAIDNIVYLFGPVKELQKQESNGTHFLILQHEKGATGTIELSTNYSWNSFVDELSINTSKSVYQANYPGELFHYNKPANISGIPMEKLTKKSMQITYDYQNIGRIPVSQNNSLVEQGYLDEIQTFVKLCENKVDSNLTSPKQVRPTYELIERIKKK